MWPLPLWAALSEALSELSPMSGRALRDLTGLARRTIVGCAKYGTPLLASTRRSVEQHGR
jgi:hypothetical protein